MFAALGALASVVGAGTGIWAARNARNAQQDNAALQMELYRRQQAMGQELFGEGPQVSFEDLMAAAQEAARYNAGEGTDLANQSADKINKQTLGDLEEGLRQLYGGTAYDDQRAAVNENVQDWLAGSLSKGAKQQVARQALATGMGNPQGDTGVSDLYAGYLGMASEDLAGKGVQAYSSLYSMYRQAFPMVTGAQILPYTTYRPEAAANDRMGIAQLELAYKQAQMGAFAGSTAGLAQTTGSGNDADASYYASIAAGIGQVGGALTSLAKPTTTGYQINRSADGNTVTYSPIESGGWKSWFGGKNMPAAASVNQAVTPTVMRQATSSPKFAPQAPGKTYYSPSNDPVLPFGDTSETSAMLLPPLTASRGGGRGWGFA